MADQRRQYSFQTVLRKCNVRPPVLHRVAFKESTCVRHRTGRLCALQTPPRILQGSHPHTSPLPPNSWKTQCIDNPRRRRHHSPSIFCFHDRRTYEDVGYKLGYRSSYTALSRVISGVIRGLSSYRFWALRALKFPLLGPPYDPAYNSTLCLITRPFSQLISS